MKLPVQLHWRCGPDMPVAMSGSIQSVEVDGTVYVGGGSTDKKSSDYLVMAYSTRSSQWHTLPQYSTRWFSMITIHGKLVLLGGLTTDDSVSNELSQWQSDSNQWTHPFPAMPIPRYVSSAASYKHWLVVAGGLGPHGYCVHTEVLDVDNEQWSKGPATPTPWQDMKSTVIGDIWYIMGGWDARLAVPEVYSISLEDLTSHSTAEDSNVWRSLPSLDCTGSCPLNIGGSLLAIGGDHLENKRPMSVIQLHVPSSGMWVQEAARVPRAISTCTCIATFDNIFLMGGHDGKTRSNEMFSSVFH